MLKLENVRLVSTNAEGEMASRAAYTQAISSDGKYVILDAVANNFPNPSGDSSLIEAIYVKNLETGELQIINSDSSGNLVSWMGTFQFLNDDNHVAFYRDDALYVKDLVSGKLSLASINDSGHKSPHIFYFFDVSLNNNLLLYNEIDSPANFYSARVYTYNYETGVATKLASSTTGIFTYLAMSADGHYASYISESTDVLADDKNGRTYDLFVQDLYTGKIIRANTDKDGNQASLDGNLSDYYYLGASKSFFTADSKSIIFQSSANNLVSNDTNRDSDIFIKNIETGEIKLLTRNKNGVQLNGYSEPLGISPDGTKLIFESYADNIERQPGIEGFHYYIKDLVTNDITEISLKGTGFDDYKYVNPWSITEQNYKITASNGHEGGFSIIFNASKSSDFSNAQVFVLDYSDAADTIWSGTSNNDVYTGTTKSDLLNGLAGNDIIHGALGDDTILGGVGFDKLYGEDGNDSLDGGTKNDLLDGGNGNDYLLGGWGTDTILGGAGQDTLYGGLDNDSIDGGTKNDRVFGDEGNDTLIGNWGSDTITGGAGADSLTGGLDADTFVFNVRSDSSAAATDIIADFTQGLDKIKLAASMGFGNIHAGYANGDLLGYHFDGANTVVESEYQDFMLVLKGHIDLTATDFIFA